MANKTIGWGIVGSSSWSDHTFGPAVSAAKGATITAVAGVNLVLQKDLVLGLEPKETALLVMTFAVSILTFGTGKTNILCGFLYLVIFGTFLFTTFMP